jgi:hypothetical protein
MLNILLFVLASCLALALRKVFLKKHDFRAKDTVDISTPLPVTRVSKQAKKHSFMQSPIAILYKCTHIKKNIPRNTRTGIRSSGRL